MKLRLHLINKIMKVSEYFYNDFKIQIILYKNLILD